MEILSQVIHYLPFNKLLQLREVSREFKYHLENTFKFNYIYRITLCDYMVYSRLAHGMLHRNNYACLDDVEFIQRWITIYGYEDFRANFIKKYSHLFHKITNSHALATLIKNGYKCDWYHLDKLQNITDEHMELYMNGFTPDTWCNSTIIDICIKHQLQKLKEHLLTNNTHELCVYYVDLECEQRTQNSSINNFIFDKNCITGRHKEQFIEFFPRFIETNADDIVLRVVEIYEDCEDFFFEPGNFNKLLTLCNNLFDDNLLHSVFSSGFTQVLQYIFDYTPKTNTAILADKFLSYLKTNGKSHNKVISLMLPHIHIGGAFPCKPEPVIEPSPFAPIKQHAVGRRTC